MKERASELVRIRILFEDRHLLTKCQRSDGLKRCWVLLKPELETISDFSAQLVSTFDLQDVCPNGLLLSMDGFVLPSFESTCILKDKDIIRVNKKGGLPTEIIRIHDGKNRIEDSEIVEKQPILSGVKLLAIEGFENGTEGFGFDHEEHVHTPDEDALHSENIASENGISKKKRKRLTKVKLQSSKRKKTRSNSPEEHSVSAIGDANNVHAKQKKSSLKKGGPLRELLQENDVNSNVNVRSLDRVALKVVDMVKDSADSTCNEVREVEPSDEVVSGSSERDDELLKSSSKYENASLTVAVKKFPSRSARRKKAKRQWLRELAKSSRKEEVKIYQEEKEIQVKSPEPQQPNEDINTEEDPIIPVVVKPGHIRFEPLDEDTVLDNQQSQDLMETFQWNGITSKKKGQKWGKVKIGSRRREDARDCNGKIVTEEAQLGTVQWSDTTSKRDQNWANEKPAECRRKDEHWNKRDLVEEEELQLDPVDFEKLIPLTFLPKEGDVVAYRLVELSSLWCPEISPFRVGKVSSYDPVSKKLTLLPVPEYPIFVEDNAEADSLPSLYNEDGSLEVEFESLIDPRIFNDKIPDQLETMKVACNGVNGGAKETASVLCSSAVAEEMLAPTKENGVPVAWEEISRALSEKKAQLLQREGDGTTKESTPSNKTAWSYRALRSNALGPTVALLRAQNST